MFDYVCRLFPELPGQKFFAQISETLWGPEARCIVDDPLPGTPVIKLLPKSLDGIPGKKAPDDPKRSHYAHLLNETFSTKDAVHPLSRTDTLESSPEALAAQYRKAIEGHINDRVFLFFQQLLACCNTQFDFENIPAKDQGQSATAIKNIKGKVLLERNAAHHSTLPCLVVYDNKKSKFIYLYGSDYYKAQNATGELPRFVNVADCAIDDPLRPFALKILNSCSHGKITPQEGVKKFVRALLRESEILRRVMQIYEETVAGISQVLEKEPERLFRQMGLSSSPEKNREKLVTETFARAMQATYAAQSRIQKILEQGMDEILAAISSEKTPNHFKKIFKIAIVENMENERNKKAMLRFIALPGDLQAVLKEAGNGALTTYALVKGQKKILDTIVGKISYEIEYLRRERTRNCGEEIARFRETANLSPLSAAKKLAISPGRLKLIEQGFISINRTFAEKLGQLFRVESSVFLPSYFDAETASGPMRYTADYKEITREGFIVIRG